VLGRLKFKIEGLVTEMLDQLPCQMWQDPKIAFLDPAMGGGQFLEQIVERLRAAGHANSNIRRRVFGVEANEGRVNFVRLKNLPIQTSVGGIDTDYEEVFGLKKFDVIVGNPPFQSPKGDNESKPIWGDFLHNSHNMLNDDGFMALVLPTRWVLPKAAKNFWVEKISGKSTLLWVNLGECSKYFKVGRGAGYIGAFVLQKTPPRSSKTILVYPNQKEIKVDTTGMQFLPIRATDIDFNILSKFLKKGSVKGFWGFRRGGRINAINQPKVGFGYRQRGTTYDNVILFDLIGDQDFVKTTNHYTWVKLPEDHNPEAVKVVFNSKIYRWFASIMIDGDFTPATQAFLVKIPVNKKINDRDIYRYFNLSVQEIDYIENLIK